MVRWVTIYENDDNTCNGQWFQKAEKTEFLAFFYKRCMYNLCQPLFANTVEVDSHPAKGDSLTAVVCITLMKDFQSVCFRRLPDSTHAELNSGNPFLLH